MISHLLFFVLLPFLLSIGASHLACDPSVGITSPFVVNVCRDYSIFNRTSEFALNGIEFIEKLPLTLQQGVIDLQVEFNIATKWNETTIAEKIENFWIDFKKPVFPGGEDKVEVALKVERIVSERVKRKGRSSLRNRRKIKTQTNGVLSGERSRPSKEMPRSRLSKSNIRSSPASTLTRLGAEIGSDTTISMNEIQTRTVASEADGIFHASKTVSYSPKPVPTIANSPGRSGVISGQSDRGDSNHFISEY